MLAALVIIWAARLTVPRDLYVSELGAEGEPTAKWFQLALVLIVVGGVAIGWVGRDIRSRPRILNLWRPSLSLFVACGFFLIASQVTCTAGLPGAVRPAVHLAGLHPHDERRDRVRGRVLDDLPVRVRGRPPGAAGVLARSRASASP